MSWWNKIVDIINKPASKINDIDLDIFHRASGVPTADEKRNQQYAINDQVKAYKDQTALTEKQINDAKASQDVVKRQINEKQIRQLRNNFRPAGGFLNNQQSLSPVQGLNSKLGG